MNAPATYHAKCECGHATPVELFQAGTQINCSQCSRQFAVPNSIALKEQSGDKYPFLNPLQKVVQTLANEEPPFDGTCQRCGHAPAEWQVPVQLKILQERMLEHDGQIRPGLGGITLVAAGGEEVWQTVQFPLLLCESCHSQFDSDRRSARIRRIIGQMVVIAIGVGFLWFAYQFAEVVAALAGVLSLIGAIAWIAMLRSKRSIDPFLYDWLKGIRWVPEAISSEEEYEITVEASQPYDRRSAV